MGIKKLALDKLIKAQNVDGTLNKAETITHYVNITLEISKQKWNEWLFITKLRKQKIILGLPWLQRENPDTNWKWKMIDWRDKPHLQPSFKTTLEEVEDRPTISTQNPMENSELLLSPDDFKDISIQTRELEELWINLKMSHSQTLAHEHSQKKDAPVDLSEIHWFDIYSRGWGQRHLTNKITHWVCVCITLIGCFLLSQFDNLLTPIQSRNHHHWSLAIFRTRCARFLLKSFPAGSFQCLANIFHGPAN